MFGIRTKKQKEAEARARMEHNERIRRMARMIEDVREGKLPAAVKPDGMIMLKDDEIVHLKLENVSLCEIRGPESEAGDASVRITKGILFMANNYSVRNVWKIVPVSQGTLYLTSRKVVFIGFKTAITIPLWHVMSGEHFTDGARIAGSSRHVPIIAMSSEVEPVYWEAFGVFLEALAKRIENTGE